MPQFDPNSLDPMKNPYLFEAMFEDDEDEDKEMNDLNYTSKGTTLGEWMFVLFVMGIPVILYIIARCIL